MSLEATLQASEQQMRELQTFLQQERQALARAKALNAACARQAEQLQYISANLPARLPESRSAQPSSAAPAPPQEAQHDQDQGENENQDSTNQPLANAKQPAVDKKRKSKAPRW